MLTGWPKQEMHSIANPCSKTPKKYEHDRNILCNVEIREVNKQIGIYGHNRPAADIEGYGGKVFCINLNVSLPTLVGR